MKRTSLSQFPNHKIAELPKKAFQRVGKAEITFDEINLFSKKKFKIFWKENLKFL